VHPFCNLQSRARTHAAEILNSQFKSAYTQEDLTNLPDVGRNTIPKLPEIRVMEKCVLKLLQNLKVHKAAGTLAKITKQLSQCHHACYYKDIPDIT
jgi:hypothetical protein